jgi:hypothetical protein
VINNKNNVGLRVQSSHPTSVSDLRQMTISFFIEEVRMDLAWSIVMRSGMMGKNDSYVLQCTS